MNGDEQSSRMIDTSEMNLNDFEEWRFIIEASIDHLLSVLPDQTREQLDYSIGSLDILEAWMLEKYENSKALSHEIDSGIIDGIFFYLGEVFRRSLGGHWNIHFAEFEPDFKYGETPVIEGFSDGKGTYCPPFLAFDILKIRSGKLASTNLMSLIESINYERKKSTIEGKRL